MSDSRMVREIGELHKRVDKLEKQKNQEVLTLLEILSNAAFFGEIKKTNCEFSKDGQCSFFVLKREAKNKFPIAMECRIKKCKEPSLHYHFELSGIFCAFCGLANNISTIDYSQNLSKKSKDIVKTQENLFNEAFNHGTKN